MPYFRRNLKTGLANATEHFTQCTGISRNKTCFALIKESCIELKVTCRSNPVERRRDAHLLDHWARRWVYHCVCDAWPVRQLTYGYLSGLFRGVFRGGRTGAPPKLSKIVATRCQILRLKCTKFNFGWGSAPDPTQELTEITDNGMKVRNLSSWLSGKSLKVLPPDVRF